MPYPKGQRLPGERASRLGHLEVMNSELVNQLCESFESGYTVSENHTVIWDNFGSVTNHLSIIFGIDGSMQPIRSEIPPYKEMAFVKTALLRLDEFALEKVDKDSPHPFALRDILSDSALYHATVFPLKHVSIPNFTVYDAIRYIIYDSLKDESLNGEPFETLKWLMYEKWNTDSNRRGSLPPFQCPHCDSPEATLPYDTDKSFCHKCGGELLISDVLGFHLDMVPEAAPLSVPLAYMNIHETLLLFTGIRHFWENKRHFLSDCLFIKDGPLSIRAQYSKLVAPIRRFLSHANKTGNPVYIFGQEKTGRFVDHLNLIDKKAPIRSLFIPQDNYIKSEVNLRPSTGAAYGKDTNYGAKVFIKIDDYHKMVISIPTEAATFMPHPIRKNLIGLERILATLPRILSSRYEGALLPIELANGVASLSTYPSAQILKVFADTKFNQNSKY